MRKKTKSSKNKKEIFKGKSKEKEEFEKFCPDCNSAELEFYAGGQLGWQMKCKKCSWIGLPFERKVKKQKGK